MLIRPRKASFYLQLRPGLDDYGPMNWEPLFSDGALVLVDGAVLLGRFVLPLAAVVRGKTTGLCQVAFYMLTLVDICRWCVSMRSDASRSSLENP